MKKSIKIASIIFILIFILFVGICIISYMCAKKSLIDYWSEDEPNYTYHKYEAIRCNYNILFPEVAIVLEQQFRDYDREFVMHFYDITNPFKQDKSSRINTGSTTVKNTTFPELVEMVKDDCYQFQEDFDAEDPETQIDWGYREAEPPRPQEEIDAEIAESAAIIREELETVISDEGKDAIREKYGDWSNMTDKEIVELSDKVGNDEEVYRIVNPEWFEIEDEMNKMDE